MDPKELRGLYEAYSEVYAPQQIDELSNRKLRAYIKKSGKSHAEINKKWDQGTATDREKSKSIGHEIGQQRAFRTLDKRTRKEDLDIFDVVLEFLQAEGFAETLEEAEWLMANIIDEEAIAIIVEAMHDDEEDDEDENEMKKGKKSKKSEEDDEDEEDEEELEESSYSATAARAGKDIGKPGKAFAKIAKSAAKRYGSKERGEKVAGAVLAKLRAKKG
jgi:hypothetical protein